MIKARKKSALAGEAVSAISVPKPAPIHAPKTGIRAVSPITAATPAGNGKRNMSIPINVSIESEQASKS